jgi:hypothetical protein
VPTSANLRCRLPAIKEERSWLLSLESSLLRSLRTFCLCRISNFDILKLSVALVGKSFHPQHEELEWSSEAALFQNGYPFNNQAGADFIKGEADCKVNRGQTLRFIEDHKDADLDLCSKVHLQPGKQSKVEHSGGPWVEKLKNSLFHIFLVALVE